VAAYDGYDIFLATAGVGNGYLAGSKDARFQDCNYTAEQ
jgi:hypothetical protein